MNTGMVIVFLLIVLLFLGFYMFYDSDGMGGKSVGALFIVLTLVPLTIYSLIGLVKTHENKIEVVEMQNDQP